MTSEPLARQPTPDLRAAARAVAAVADARAGRAGTTVTLPDATVAALRDSHLFALLVPRALGGYEADPATQIEVFETVARADGSAGWCLMAGAIASGVAAAYTGEAAAQRMFGRGGPVVHAGQLAPRGEATATEDGFRVNGRWSFGSGLAHCQWVLGGCVRVEGGRPRVLPSGLPEMIVVCVPLEQVQMRGNWNVIGLQETGSFDYEISDVLVPADQVFSLFASEPRRGGALYRMGVLLLTAAGHTGFALGVGRRALDEIAVLAPQRQRLGEETLVDQASFQREYARREARLRAARLLALEAFGEAYRAVAAGDALDLAHRATVRMATTHATEVAVEAADFAYRAAGSESLRTPNVIQRCFRDLHAGAQHIFVGDKTWSDAGSVLLGAAPPDLIL